MTQQESEPNQDVQPAATLLPAEGAWPVEVPTEGRVLWRGPSGGVSMTVATTADAVWVAVDRQGIRPGVLDALGWWLSEALAARFVPDAAEADAALRDAATTALSPDWARARVVGWVGTNVATVVAARRILCALALGIRAAGAGGTVGPLIAAWANEARAPDPGGWLGLVVDDGLWAQGQELAGPEGTAALWVEALTGRWLLVSPVSARGSIDAERLAARAGVPVHLAPTPLGDAARSWHQQVSGQRAAPEVFLLDAALAPAEWQERVADRVLRHAVHATWVPAHAPAPGPAAPSPTPYAVSSARDLGTATSSPSWEWVGPPLPPPQPTVQPAPTHPAPTHPAPTHPAPTQQAPAPSQPSATQPAVTATEAPSPASVAPVEPVGPAPDAVPETAVPVAQAHEADREPDATDAGEPLPAADDAGRFDVLLVDAGPDLARTATLLVAALGVQRSVADAWCATLPAQVAREIDAARVRRLDTLVRAGANATLRIVRLPAGNAD